MFQFSSVQSLSRVRLFAIPWIAVRQASLSITNSRTSLRLTSIESVMPSSHLILCHPLLLLPPTPPSIRVFSNESTLRMRWPKYWSQLYSLILWYYSVQLLSRVRLFVTPMNRSTPGLPVHHQLPEFTQTHIHRVSDAIPPSHPVSSPSPPAPNPSQPQSLFQWVNS